MTIYLVAALEELQGSNLLAPVAIVLDCGRVLDHPRAMSFTVRIETARGCHRIMLILSPAEICNNVFWKLLDTSR
jgi:hypothetical protein